MVKGFFLFLEPKEAAGSSRVEELNPTQTQASSSQVVQEAVSRNPESNECMTTEQPASTAPSENHEEMNILVENSHILDTANISVQIGLTEDT